LFETPKFGRREECSFSKKIPGRGRRFLAAAPEPGEKGGVFCGGRGVGGRRRSEGKTASSMWGKTVKRGKSDGRRNWTLLFMS